MANNCAVCHKQLVQKVQMGCDHHLCLLCAYQWLIYESQLVKYFVECPNCGVQTELEANAVQDIEKAVHIEVQQPKPNDDKQVKLERITQPSQAMKNIPNDTFCSDHRQVRVSLVCQRCGCIPICNYCTQARGLHQSHQVQQIDLVYLERKRNMENKQYERQIQLAALNEMIPALDDIMWRINEQTDQFMTKVRIIVQKIICQIKDMETRILSQCRLKVKSLLNKVQQQHNEKITCITRQQKQTKNFFYPESFPVSLLSKVQLINQSVRQEQIPRLVGINLTNLKNIVYPREDAALQILQPIIQAIKCVQRDCNIFN